MTTTLENSNAKKLPQYVAALSGGFILCNNIKRFASF